MRFTDLRLAEPILRAVAAAGYNTPSPIQAQTIPHTLDGRDVLGCAQTGTGKTAAFALPVLDALYRDTPKPRGRRIPRCLVLCPTRELASQIGESFDEYGRHTGLKHVTIFGGVGQRPQVEAIKRGLDVIIATPGRLMDLMNQGLIDLREITTLILDEADRMLDMGFIPDIRRITKKLPPNRQTLLFSATMPREIRKLAHDLLTDPVTIEVAAQSTTADRIAQRLYHIPKKQKTALLAHLLLTESVSRAIVFSRTKHGCDRIVRQLRRYSVPAEAIHGNKSQNQRTRSLDRFRSGKAHVLIATDIASRGIDVDDVSHVFNYDMSNDPESYVHRIGRTARAGASGIAISFCDESEASQLRAIQRLIRLDIPLAATPTDLPEPTKKTPANPTQKPRKPKGEGHGGAPQPTQSEGEKTNKKKRSRRRRGQRGASKSGGSAHESHGQHAPGKKPPRRGGNKPNNGPGRRRGKR
ncbi:MAG: DEAD/DEAH box helicase [Planctomycetota bacterium]